MTKNPNNKQPEFSYTFTYSSYFCYCVAAYTISKFLDENSIDKIIIAESNDISTKEFNIDYDKTEQLVTDTKVCYLLKNKTLLYVVFCTSCGCTIEMYSDNNFDKTLDGLKYAIKNGNVLRNRHIKIDESQYGFSASFEKPPKISVNDVILDKDLKDQLIENTVFHLKEMSTNNGIILHGPPGTGKSLSCSLIVDKALEAGFSTCYLTSQVNYSELQKFLKEFLSPCILIMEDIDSFAIQRSGHSRSMLSDFLQFLSGITLDKEQIIVVATTNYIEHLDEAINNRPARFNRFYEYNYPTDTEIDALIDRYFGKNLISKDSKRLCYGKNFTGSHISEIHNTACRLAKKHKAKIPTQFVRAVTAISSHFKSNKKDNNSIVNNEVDKVAQLLG